MYRFFEAIIKRFGQHRGAIKIRRYFFSQLIKIVGGLLAKRKEQKKKKVIY